MAENAAVAAFRLIVILATGFNEKEFTMETGIHAFRDLFAQLGLPNSDDEIADFIRAHSPLPDFVKLADAPCWTQSQAAFLRDELAEDADWAEVIDQLSAALRRT